MRTSPRGSMAAYRAEARTAYRPRCQRGRDGRRQNDVIGGAHGGGSEGGGGSEESEGLGAEVNPATLLPPTFGFLMPRFFWRI